MTNNLAEILDQDDAFNPQQEKALQILSEACRLFAERGFEGTSMRDIAAACKISKATLYHYFPDKDALFRPLALGTTKAVYAHVAARIGDEHPPLERLRRFMLGTADFFQRYRWAWIAATTIFWTDPEARRRKQRLEWRDRYEALLRGILQDAMSRGDIRPMDVALAGRLVLSALNWLPRWYDPAGPRSATEIAEEFYEMIVTGFRAS
ncbi:TetR/AcrR family transcriptional regulator [Muricoccus radiodurans]|uniref:TetR/AcrR family transcriptional regulator n=1 Tax=Muricoccus radiodurans TaxID=2231721 RepID=UPI003CFA3E26